MERELIISGIGGQGVQLAAAVVARAAVAEGREVQAFGSYGGMMRGGATESTVVVADRPVESPPTVGSAWSVVLMHHEHARGALAHAVPGTVVFVNSSVVGEMDLPAGCSVVEVSATDIALAEGDPVGASMAMIGAYVAATGLVDLESLCSASRDSLPSYRSHHADRNDRTFRAGFGSVALGSTPAWDDREPAA